METNTPPTGPTDEELLEDYLTDLSDRREANYELSDEEIDELYEGETDEDEQEELDQQRF